MADFRARQQDVDDPSHAQFYNQSIQDVKPTYGVKVRTLKVAREQLDKLEEGSADS